MGNKKSAVEGFKAASRFLRGTIASGLDEQTQAFGEADKQILKFHGLYQQDDRDRRAALRLAGAGKAYSFMVRSKIPAGRLTAGQYLVHDDLASDHGNGTLRITTRQALQLHGVLKGDVRSTLAAIDAALLSTLGACGDVVRNVMCCPAPVEDPIREAIEAQASEMAQRFTPRTQSYHELWLDGERIESTSEPFYGAGYLPRKFKIAIAYPGDNCVDVYTQDVGAVALADSGRLLGYNVLAGGGLGMTHNKPETFPRLADPVAFVRPDELLEVVEGIVAIHRDHGDRGNRRHARLKYLIHDRGLDWFVAELEDRIGRRFDPPVGLARLHLHLHLGWQRQDASRWYRGVFVENGRIEDRGDRYLRTAVREILRQFGCGVRLTPGQDLLLTGIEAAARPEIESVLTDYGVGPEPGETRARVHSMACPALPTCGLALAEAERALPSIVRELEPELTRLGLADEPLTIRMTGCPNGCARPYVADLAFVGRTLDRYVIRVGGRADGTRLNQVYADLVSREDLVAEVVPLLELFRDGRESQESFGDFCQRVGVRVLRAYTAALRGTAHHG